jgi:exodeoxyribonuclease VII small subunit
MKKSEIDYKTALVELQKIVEKIEDPNTDLRDISKYVKRANELIKRCRELLREIEDNLPEMT